MTRSTLARLRGAAALLALLATACAPAVPNLSGVPGDAAASASTTTKVVATSTTVPPATSTTAAPSTTTSTTVTTTTTTTALAPAVTTVGPWSFGTQVRDESGEQFTAIVSAPEISADVDPALLARVVTLVDGHVESQVGATLALWRSIEGQGERDLTGSTLEMNYEIAGFEEGFISLRFFSEEQVAGSSGVKRQVTTLMVDLESGIAIGLDDIIFGGESRVALLALVQDRLLSEYFEDDDEAYSLWAGNLAPSDLDRAALTPRGLEIWFDELEVGPPAIGMPVIAIPYDQLTEILDPAGPASFFGVTG